MLSKQVKLRRRANRAKRKLCASRKMRACVQLAVRSGCHQQLLSSKHLVKNEARLDAWSDFKHVVLEDGDIVHRNDLTPFEQQRLALINQYAGSHHVVWQPGFIKQGD